MEEFGETWLDGFFGSPWLVSPSVSHLFAVFSRVDPPDGDLSLRVYRETKAFYERLINRLFSRRGILFMLDEFCKVGELVIAGDKITLHFVPE